MNLDAQAVFGLQKLHKQRKPPTGVGLRLPQQISRILLENLVKEFAVMDPASNRRFLTGHIGQFPGFTHRAREGWIPIEEHGKPTSSPNFLNESSAEEKGLTEDGWTGHCREV